MSPLLLNSSHRFCHRLPAFKSIISTTNAGYRRFPLHPAARQQDLTRQEVRNACPHCTKERHWTNRNFDLSPFPMALSALIGETHNRVTQVRPTLVHSYYTCLLWGETQSLSTGKRVKRGDVHIRLGDWLLSRLQNIHKHVSHLFHCRVLTQIAVQAYTLLRVVARRP